MQVRLLIALAAYLVLAILAAVVLIEERIRLAVFVLLGGLALKTAIAAAQQRKDTSQREEDE